MTAILRSIRSGSRLEVVMPDTAAGLYLTDQQITENSTIVVTGALTAPRPLFLPHSTLTYDIWCNTTTQGILVKGTSAETGLAIGVGVGAHVFSDGGNWRSTTGASGLGLDIPALTEKGGAVAADLLVLADSDDSDTLKKITFANLMTAAGLSLVGDVTGPVGSNSITSIGTVPLSEVFSGGAERNVLTYDGYSLNFAPVDINGESGKSPLDLTDEFHIHDPVAGDNAKATLSDVELSLVSPVADTLSYRIGPGHRASLGGAPTNVFTGIGDGTSTVQDVKFEATPTGVSWRQSKRFSDVASAATVSVIIGYIYVDATFTMCPRIGGILTVETSTKG